MQSKLILKDGTVYEGKSFGANESINGEVVFATGMTGYPESLTDPSYAGQILVMTYPLIGNYGVPDKKTWESGKIQVAGLVVSTYNETPSHFLSQRTLSKWLKDEGIPALEIKDTRALALRLREKGCILGKIVNDVSLRANASERSNLKKDRHVARQHSLLAMTQPEFEDPNLRNLAAEVSIKKPKTIGTGKKTVLLLDCGAKNNIAKELAKRGVKVVQTPWNYDPFAAKLKFHGLMISNGPGDPKMCTTTIETIRKVLAKKIPTFGICLGNQLLALAAGGDTAKMKFGHRGQNQPVVMVASLGVSSRGANASERRGDLLRDPSAALGMTPRRQIASAALAMTQPVVGKSCYLTTQNHGFHVSRVPKGFKPWFINLNDGTNEGIIHNSLPFMSVQFHPESCPGPLDTGWLFDNFIKKL